MYTNTKEMKKFIESKINNFSKLTGLDLTYFIGGGFWLTFSMLLIAISGIFLSSTFARFLTKDVFGQYSYLMSILGLAGLATLPGMSQAVLQGASENKDGVYRKSIITVFKWSLIGALALILFSIYYFFVNNNNLSVAILISAIVFPINAASNLYISFLSGKKKFRHVAIYGTISQLASILATAFALFVYPSLIVIALFSAWSTAIVNVCLTFYSFKYIANNSQDNKLITLGFHLSFSQIFMILADYLDRLLIPILLGFTNNAVYAIAILIPMQIHGFLKMFMTLGQPKVSELNSKGLKKGLIVKSLQLEIFTIIIIATYIINSPIIFNILYPNYAGDAILLSQIFSLSLLYFPGNILSLLFIREKTPSAIHTINILYAGFTVVSLFIFIPIFGLIGAIIAKLFCRLLQFILQIYLFSRVEVSE